MAANQAATVDAPTTGRRAWRTLPPPSVHRVTSGDSNSIRALTSPPVEAAKNRSVTSRCLERSVGKRGRRARTCSRARCAACRTAASDRSTASAISAWLKSKTSLSTNTARSSGLSVSSTTSIAIDTDSASVTASAASPPVRMGSGSHGPTYVSRLYRVERSRSSARFDTIRVRYALGSATCERSAADHLIQASWTASSASAAVPRKR